MTLDSLFDILISLSLVCLSFIFLDLSKRVRNLEQFKDNLFKEIENESKIQSRQSEEA